MAVVTRLILALMLAVQSLPGLAVERCAEMTLGMGMSAVDATATDNSARPCCSGGKGEPTGSACTNSDAVTVCKCGTPRPEQPKAPPSDSRTDQVQLAAAILPGFLGFAFEAVDQPAPGVGWLGAPPKRSANSVQSVLCVWVV
ncbi:MAG: hypothetical protein IT437_11685 [Phycisphaerales bacterium]|nr:hypothetical protein [Phycisphaerales bacterium]